jgi:2-iminobutanoate/2-iminopropanoate deaminase
MATCLAAALAACATAPSVALLHDPASTPLGPYSQAVAAGDFVFVSGIVAFDSTTGTFAAAEIGPQTTQAISNLESLLRANGLSLDDVVKTTVFLRNASDMPGMNAVYADRFSARPPARTTVPGADWGRPDILIEIEAIAVRRQRR